MKAISLWQPWASLIACGAKPFETRHWAPPRELIGQTIAIHAAKKVDKGAVELAVDLAADSMLMEALKAVCGPVRLQANIGPLCLPIGCIVATARLDAAFQLGEPADGTAVPAARVVKRMISRQMPECFTVRYDDFGDYASGRWAWLLRDVKPLPTPLQATGRQGFFDFPMPLDA
jgi:hypothetical protein